MSGAVPDRDSARFRLRAPIWQLAFLLVLQSACILFLLKDNVVAFIVALPLWVCAAAMSVDCARRSVVVDSNGVSILGLSSKRYIRHVAIASVEQERGVTAPAGESFEIVRIRLAAGVAVELPVRLPLEGAHPMVRELERYRASWSPSSDVSACDTRNDEGHAPEEYDGGIASG